VAAGHFRTREEDFGIRSEGILQKTDFREIVELGPEICIFGLAF
jgi:hypothetical protein